mgnify:CR=1 FL=1
MDMANAEYSEFQYYWQNWDFIWCALLHQFSLTEIMTKSATTTNNANTGFGRFFYNRSIILLTDSNNVNLYFFYKSKLFGLNIINPK